MGSFIFRLLVWALIFVLGALTAARYGVPQWAQEATAPAFEWVEQYLPLEGGVVSEDPDTTVQTRPVEKPAAATGTANGDLQLNSTLRINEAGLDIIKVSEGLRLEAYSAGGRDYIGYGHQMAPGEPRQISEAEADRLLRQDVQIAEEAVRQALTHQANVNQFSAMVSLTYNIGSGNFRKSPVLANFNAGRLQAAADAFLTHNRAGGQVLDKLTQRRQQERALFLTPA